MKDFKMVWTTHQLFDWMKKSFTRTPRTEEVRSEFIQVRSVLKQLDKILPYGPDRGAAGRDGSHAHPTQTLSDLFTIYERNIDFSSLEISIVGDFLFSRVARSTIIGFAMMGSKVNIIGPSELISNEIIRAYENLPLIKNGQITVYDEIEKPLMKSDIVMPLRIQKERFTSSFNLDFESYKKFWKIDEKLINNSNKNILIMHPGPVNEEIEISHKLVHSDKSLINLQVENGVFIRETIMRELLS